MNEFAGCRPAAHRFDGSDRDRSIRLLLFGDTHLGFDLPFRPRVERRRRGHDFFANFEHILEVAVSERVDCVVHVGDMFYRSRVPAALVQRAFLPIKRVADAGIPFVIVPGNHERSRIPHDLLVLHERIHVFDRPRTYVVDANGMKLAFSGFPYQRTDVRSMFPDLVDATRWYEATADANLLCVHHCFEGAIVGYHNYTFRNGQDVVRVRDVPAQFDAVLSGHVHRAQVLQGDLQGAPIPTPIIYPGAIERTSFAERNEEKGYFLVLLGVGRSTKRVALEWEFRKLPTRPMVLQGISVDGLTRPELERKLVDTLTRLPGDAVLQLRIDGVPATESRLLLAAKRIRELAPPTMNVEVLFVDERNRSSGRW